MDLVGKITPVVLNFLLQNLLIVFKIHNHQQQQGCLNCFVKTTFLKSKPSMITRGITGQALTSQLLSDVHSHTSVSQYLFDNRLKMMMRVIMKEWKQLFADVIQNRDS